MTENRGNAVRGKNIIRKLNTWQMMQVKNGDLQKFNIPVKAI